MWLAVSKFNLQDRLMQSKCKLLYRLGKCDNCFGFWVAVLAVLFVNSVTWDFDRTDLLMPFAILGAHLLLNLNFKEK